MLPSQTMTERKSDLNKAAKKASLGLMEALCLVEKFIDISSSEERQPISNRIETLFPGRIRSQGIYSKLMWFTTQVIMLHVYQLWGPVPQKVLSLTQDCAKFQARSSCLRTCNLS